jgi:hypothetical protein
MSSKNKLPHLIETRVDETKYNELKQLAVQTKSKRMSELIRDILYNRKIKIVTYDASLDKVMEELSAIRSELNAIGVNINQVTRYFNSDPDPRQKISYAATIVEQYQVVGRKVDILIVIVSKLAERWLQE